MDNRRKRRICVFTGSRADYGPLSPLIRRLSHDDDVDLRILASGGHLVTDQGMTVREIEEDGLTVDERVDIVLSSDSPVGITKSFGLACIGFADALERISPDLLVIAGDRYEALAMAISALPGLIPVAHVAGGQLTYGSTDDPTRHAISKLSHLHFAFTFDARRRLIQMGESPANVFHVGPIGIDPLASVDLLTPTELDELFDIPLGRPLFLVTHHPATADPQRSRESTLNLLAALDGFPESTVVFTAPNVDHGSREIYDSLREYVEKRSDTAALVPSLGQKRYLSLVKQADLVLGNSSSGITEAPLFGTPTVNIGTRQDGRPRARSVVDCGTSSSEIVEAIDKAMELPDLSFHPALDHVQVEESLGRVVRTLKEVDLRSLTPKVFVEHTFDVLTGEVNF